MPHSELESPRPVTAEVTGAKSAWWPVAAAAVLGLVWPGGRAILADYGIEIIMIGLISFAIFSHPEIEQLTGAAPAIAKRLAKVFVAALVLAQVLGLTQQVWPLTDWAMYTAAPPQTVTTYQFDGLTADGEHVGFMPSFDNRTLSTKTPQVFLRGKAALVHRLRLEPGDPDELSAATTDLADSLHVFAALHNDQDPDKRVATVIVTRVSFGLEADERDTIQRDEVFRLPIGAP